MKLRIIEEVWGINRSTGKRSVRTISNKAFEPSVGSVLKFTSSGRYFTIDDICKDNITVTVHCKNTEYNKILKINKGESAVYNPRSIDGGYKYRLVYEDENSTNKYAVAISVEKAKGEHDLGQSKFFGSPTVPNAWKDRFHDDIVFLAQIRLADIAEFDYDNRLPHTGYLYFFLDAEMYPSDQLYVWVEYYPDEPDTVIVDFNAMSPIPDGLNDDWLINFYYADADKSGTKLFGTPSGVINENGDEQNLLLQYDPLDFDGVPFLNNLDGYAYVFFGEDETDFESVSYKVERS